MELRSMVRHNNAVPNGHYRKHWCPSGAHKGMVRTWFTQPFRKARRRRKREEKAKAVFPRPASGPIRPIVRCPSQRYNMKARLGRGVIRSSSRLPPRASVVPSPSCPGFTLDELKVVGLSPRRARTIGVAVDHRRQNHSEEALNLNVQRLRAYMGKLVLFPRKRNRPQEGDGRPQQLAEAVQDKSGRRDGLKGAVAEPVEAPRPATEEERDTSAFETVRRERRNVRLLGVRFRRERRMAEKRSKTAPGKK